jgi:hypothetical protein
MSATADPAELLREAVAAERARKGSVKAAIAAVARACGLQPRRVESAWWRQPARYDWQEAEQIRAALAKQWAAEAADFEARAAQLRARLQSMETTA